MFKFLKNKKGFTLIEVLVVVVIIGILAALAAPRILGRIDDARKASDVALAKTLENAIATYMLDAEADPGTPVGPPEDLTVLFPSGDLTKYVDKATADYVNDNWIDEGITIQGKVLVITYNPANGSVTAAPAPAGD